MAKPGATNGKDNILKYPVVELKVYPGKSGEVEDIRVMVNQSDFPDDITAANYLLKSYTNTANNDANETMTTEDRRKANAEYHKHHTEKIYFKPYHRKTAKTLLRSLEKFGIEDYRDWDSILKARKEIEKGKADLEKLKETQKKETEKHTERLGDISIPVDNKSMIIDTRNYAMNAEFVVPNDYKSLNFSTESKRNLDYAMKRFKNGIGISPQVNRVQFKNEYFRPFIDVGFLRKNKYISNRDVRDILRKHNKRVHQTLNRIDKHNPTLNRIDKHTPTLNRIDEEGEEDQEGVMKGGAYRPISLEEFVSKKFLEKINEYNKVLDYEREKELDQNRISPPILWGTLINVQLDNGSTMEATIDNYIGYASVAADGNTKCAAPINTAKLYGKENKCDNFYIVTYYAEEGDKLSEKIYSDNSTGKPIAVPQSRIKIINDSLVERLNDEINIPFTNVNFFNFLHMVKYALTKMSTFTDAWNVKYILSILKSKSLNNAVSYSDNDTQEEDSDSDIEEEGGSHNNGGTRRRKKHLRKTRKNGGGTITANPLYKLLNKYIDTSNITDTPDEPGFIMQRIPIYVVIEQLRFLTIIAKFIQDSNNKFQMNKILLFNNINERIKILSSNKTAAIFVDSNELPKINDEIRAFIKSITYSGDNILSYKRDWKELLKKIEDWAQLMYKTYTLEIFSKDDAMALFIVRFIRVLNEAYPTLYDSVSVVESYVPPQQPESNSRFFGRNSKVSQQPNNANQQTDDHESHKKTVRVKNPHQRNKQQSGFTMPLQL
jgi:hypothetical protein